VTESASKPTPREEYSNDIPHGYLPALRYRELPEPVKLSALFGPGVVLAAAGIGSGEFILWPNIAQQAGLGHLWGALLGSVFMFFIAAEAVRYTLATGETIITGFARLWRGWTLGFILFALLPNLWPGYASGVATILSFIVGPLDSLLVTIASLVLIVAMLLLAPVVYSVLEFSLKLMMVIMAAFVIFAVFAVTVLNPGTWADLVLGLGNVGSLPPGDVVNLPEFAGAIAFAGAGGTGVLLVSNYVREKNLGMGAHIPRITSPFTGREEPGSTIGFTFLPDEESMRRWRGWWRALNWEQFLSFFLFTVLSIFIMSALAAATLSGQDAGAGFDFIEIEAGVLGESFSGVIQLFFLVAGLVALFSTNLAVWDSIGRITADQLKVYWLRDSRFWSESRIYALTLIALLVFSVVTLLSGLRAPLLLLVIVSFLSGITSFVYTILIIQLNRRSLPAHIRMGLVRTAVMAAAVVFYGFFFVITIVDLVSEYL
jgi:Mn2+/Fe2+ NRAMP family transporter